MYTQLRILKIEPQPQSSAILISNRHSTAESHIIAKCQICHSHRHIAIIENHQPTTALINNLQGDSMQTSDNDPDGPPSSGLGMKRGGAIKVFMKIFDGGGTEEFRSLFS